MKKNICLLSVFFTLMVFSQPSYSAGGSIVSGSLMTIQKAINNKEDLWASSFNTLKEISKKMYEAIDMFDETREKKIMISKDLAINNPPADKDGALSIKATEASQWGAIHEHSEGMEGYLSDVSTKKTSKNNDYLRSTEVFKERSVTDIVDKERKTDRGISSPLTNVSIIYNPKTYRDYAYPDRDAIMGASNLENELYDAFNLSGLIISPYNEEENLDAMMESSKTSLDRSDFMSNVARKSLAFEVMNSSISNRTNIKGADLGVYMKKYLKKLDEDADLNFSDNIVNNMEDDISKYEFMDIMFSKVLLNPSFYTSFDGMTGKTIKRKKVEMLAFLNMLNWETSKMMNKYADLSAANLAKDIQSK